MTLKKLGLLLTGAAAAAALMIACGEVDPNTPAGACTSTSCASNELCHPTAKICVLTCNSGSDCPDTARNCAPLAGAASDAGSSTDGGSSGGQKICQCATDQLCNSGGTTNLVCSNEHKVCVSKCTSDSSCGSGRTCVAGQCTVSAPVDAGTPDAGTGTCTPACNTSQVCNASNVCVAKCTLGSCSSGVCNLGSGLCETAAACNASNQQPDTCSYGRFCASGSCNDVTFPPTCSNFGSGGLTPVWTSSSTGPVIYEVTPLPGTDDAFCGTAKAFTARIKAYSPVTLFPTDGNSTQLQGFWYVDTAGNKKDSVASPAIFRPQSGYTVSTDRKQVELQVTLCTTTVTGSTIQAGFYFTGGNETCATLQD